MHTDSGMTGISLSGYMPYMTVASLEMSDEPEILPPAELLKQYFEKRAALDHEIDKTLSEIQKILGIDIKSCN